MAERFEVTADDMVSAMGGQRVSGTGRVVPARLSIDSRGTQPGDAFFAIVAARNGHAFVADAVAAGATVVVVSEAVAADLASAVTVIRVADTTRALQDLARAVRRRAGTKVVAITGSAGKTTTKETTAAFLEAAFTVVKNPGNLNNHLGLPLSLFELRHGADVAVMELGMNHAGEIRVLVATAEPEVRVWTNVGDAHIGHFGSVDALAAAKAEIMDGATAGSLLVANADDPRVMAYADRFAGRVLTFGTRDQADVRAVDIVDDGLQGMQARVTTPRGSAYLRVPLPGLANLSNVLCATAVATEIGVPIDAIAERAARLRPARRRGEVRVLDNGVTVIDDSYNSSPAALTRALETLGAARRAARRVAVLGEMLELGERAESLHESCGRAVARAGVDLLITAGGQPARALGEAAVAAGLDPARVRHVDNSTDAAALAAASVRAGDVVLVKGSRGIRMDVVVDRLVEGHG